MKDFLIERVYIRVVHCPNLPAGLQEGYFGYVEEAWDGDRDTWHQQGGPVILLGIHDKDGKLFLNGDPFDTSTSSLQINAVDRKCLHAIHSQVYLQKVIDYFGDHFGGLLRAYVGKLILFYV